MRCSDLACRAQILDSARSTPRYLSGVFFFNDTATTEIYTLSLHDALPICFSRRLRSQHGAHRQLRDTHHDAVTLRIPFAQPHVRQWWVGEHTVGHKPIARAALFSRQVVPDDPKVIAGDVGELRAAGAVPH